MLEAPLEKVLHDEGLKFDLDLEFRHLAFELVRFDEGLNFRDAGDERLHFHVAFELLLFGPFRRHPLALRRRTIEAVARGGYLGIPLQPFPLVFETFIGRADAFVVVLGQPGGIDLIGDAVAKVCVFLKLGCLGQELESLVRRFRGDPARRELVHDLLQNGLVFPIRLGGGGRRVEILLKAGLEDPVVIDVPVLAIPADNFAAGIEKRHILAQKTGAAIGVRRLGGRRCGGLGGGVGGRVGNLGQRQGGRGQTNQQGRLHALVRSFVRKIPLLSTSSRKINFCPF